MKTIRVCANRKCAAPPHLSPTPLPHTSPPHLSPTPLPHTSPPHLLLFELHPRRLIVKVASINHVVDTIIPPGLMQRYCCFITGDCYIVFNSPICESNRARYSIIQREINVIACVQMFLCELILLSCLRYCCRYDVVTHVGLITRWLMDIFLHPRNNTWEHVEQTVHE